MTVRRLVVGVAGVRLEDGDLTLTVTIRFGLDVRGCRSASSTTSGSLPVTSVGTTVDRPATAVMHNVHMTADGAATLVAAPVELTRSPRRCSTICSLGGASASGEVGADGDRAPAIRQKAAAWPRRGRSPPDGSTLWLRPRGLVIRSRAGGYLPGRPPNPVHLPAASARAYVDRYQLWPDVVCLSGTLRMADGCAAKTLGGHPQLAQRCGVPLISRGWGVCSNHGAASQQVVAV